MDIGKANRKQYNIISNYSYLIISSNTQVEAMDIWKNLYYSYKTSNHSRYLSWQNSAI